jgi:hypothetical protein
MAIAGRVTIVLFTLAHILPRIMGVSLSYRALDVRTEMPDRLVAVVSAALLFRVAFWARSRVKQLRAAPKAIVIDQSGQTESIDAAIEHQLRSLGPPVLYLRSFHVDLSVEPSRFGHHQTVEEGLVEALAPIGPSVAFGCPGETLAFPGAIRLYCKRDHWRHCVKKLVDACALCVIVAGNTQSLRWELAHCIARLPPCKLLIFFPRSRFTDAQRQEFLHSTIGLFPVGLPVIYPDTAFICFEDGWVPRCLSCQAAPLWFRMERASSGPLRAYQSILAPVFSRLHIDFTPPSAAPFMTFLAISAVLLVWAFAVEASMRSLVVALAPLAGLVLLTSDWRGVLTGRA